MADHVAGLLPRIARDVDLTVLYPGSPPTAPEADGYRLLPVEQFARYYARQPQDLLVGHMGNNPYHRWIWDLLRRWRGLVVAHDACYHHFFKGTWDEAGRPDEYLNALLRWHGTPAREFGRALARAQGAAAVSLKPGMFQYSLVGPLLERAAGAIVHNRHAERTLRASSGIPVHLLPLYFDAARRPAAERRAAAGRRPMLLSLGHVFAHKRLDVVLRALGALHRAGIDFRFVVAGQVAPELPYDIQKIAQAEGIGGLVETLGYVSERDMRSLLESADAAINLRYPTAGESSASLVEMMGHGLPVAVSDHGASAELPDDTVIKIPVDEREHARLEFALRELITSASTRDRVGNAARRFVTERYGIDRVAESYLRISEATVRRLAGAPAARAKRSWVSLMQSLAQPAAVSRAADLIEHAWKDALTAPGVRAVRKVLWVTLDVPGSAPVTDRRSFPDMDFERINRLPTDAGSADVVLFTEGMSAAKVHNLRKLADFIGDHRGVAILAPPADTQGLAPLRRSALRLAGARHPAALTAFAIAFDPVQPGAAGMWRGVSSYEQLLARVSCRVDSIHVVDSTHDGGESRLDAVMFAEQIANLLWERIRSPRVHTAK